jgi:hypothetical protein
VHFCSQKLSYHSVTDRYEPYGTVLEIYFYFISITVSRIGGSSLFRRFHFPKGQNSEGSIFRRVKIPRDGGKGGAYIRGQLSMGSSPFTATIGANKLTTTSTNHWFLGLLLPVLHV